MPVKKLKDIPVEQVAAGKDTTRQILWGSQETPNFAMRKFSIAPGGNMPNHTNTVEHEQYVLRGRARIGLGEKVIEVQQHDVIYIPAGLPHWYETIGNEPFEFLCMVPNKEDQIKIVK